MQRIVDRSEATAERKRCPQMVTIQIENSINRGRKPLPISVCTRLAYSAGMKVSMMLFTVPSSISSARAALKSAKMGLSLANAMA